MRMEMARFILQHPQLVHNMLEIAFQNDNPISARACRVLEYAARQDLRYLDPHLDQWVSGLSGLHLDSSIRPMAKICELLVLEYYGEASKTGTSCLAPKHLEIMVSACFNWLIGPHKVAPKAYSMTSLYHLGKDHDWVHAELQLLLENEYSNGSAAYKARARQILWKLRNR